MLILVTLLIVGPWMGLWPSHVKAAGPYVFTGGGNGTTIPYLVLTPEDMNHVKDDLGKNYKQGADIDLSGYNSGAGWVPIGTQNTPFTGTFDGNGYRLSGLVINSSAPYVGLFGNTQGTTIKNVSLENINITGVSGYIGGLAGLARGTFTDIYVSGIITANSNNGGTGGLAGLLADTASIIRNSYAAVNVSATSTVGGLVGWVDTQTNGIVNSYASGSVTGGNTIGGLTGYSYGLILNSYATGNVQGSSNYIGGLAGMLQNALQMSFATGSVNGGSSLF